MKILYVITKARFGGAQRYVYDLATAFSERGNDVAVVFGEGGALREKLETAGIRTVQIPGLGRDIRAGDFLLPVRLFRLYRRERPDVIHLNSSKIGAVGALAARLLYLTPGTWNLEPKIIFTAHGWAFTEPRPRWQQIILAVAQWFTVLLCHQTIAVSGAVKKQADILPFASGKITVIHNGVVPPTFLPQHEARTALIEKAGQSGISNNTLWIGTIAELTYNKGLRFLIEAVATLPPEEKRNINIFLIGDGKLYEELAERIRRNDLSNMVFLLGHIDNAARYLKAFDIFTLTSLKEGFPYVLLEASAAGIPAVASKTGGIPEIIHDAETGILVPPGDIAAIRTALSSLIARTDTRSRYNSALSRHGTQQYGFEQMREKTEALYKKAARLGRTAKH